jgi:putative endonuclease
MPDWYLYIIENKLGHYYTGISTDINRRFNEHQSGGKKCAKALKGKTPLSLKYCVGVKNQSDALKAELWVKSLSRQNKNKLIVGDLLPEFEFHIPAPKLIPIIIR